MRFSACQRLRSAKDFEKLRKKGKRIDCGCFIWQILERDDLGPRRLGVIASRRVGNAVIRNRAKRVFREIFRLNQDNLPPCSDLVIVVRSHFENYTFEQLQERFLKACRQYKDAK